MKSGIPEKYPEPGIYFYFRFRHTSETAATGSGFFSMMGDSSLLE
jgi:hypothetical protein